MIDIEMIFGLVMFYSWIHGIVICFKKLTNLTSVEKVIMFTAFATIVLFVVGVISE